MSELTSKLRLHKPTINGEETENTWGYDLNNNFDIIDAANCVQDGDHGDVVVSSAGTVWRVKREVTISEQPPSGGVNGDLWLQYNLQLPPAVNWDVSSSFFNTRTEASGTDIPGPVLACQTGGLSVAGDGGHGLYKRLNAIPTDLADPIYFRSLDRYRADGTQDPTTGGYWQFVPDPESGTPPPDPEPTPDVSGAEINILNYKHLVVGTNWTPAFAAAVAAASSGAGTVPGTTGGVVYCPPGEYRIETPLLPFTYGVTIRGADLGRTHIVRTHDAGPTFSWVAGSTVIIGGGLRDITLHDPQPWATMANSPFQVVVDWAQYMVFSNVRLLESMGGMLFKGVAGSFISDVNIFITSGPSTGRSAICFDATTNPASPHDPSAPGAHCGDIFMERCNLQASNSCLDYLLDIRALDGLWCSDTHFIGAKLYNIRLTRDTSAFTFNIFFSNVMSDISYGGGMIIEGAQAIIGVGVEGRFSCVGQGTRNGPTQDGIVIRNACADASLDVSLEGYKGNGILVDADVENLVIHPRHIRSCNPDNLGGNGITVSRCKSMVIEGGIIGNNTGSGASVIGAITMNYGILLGPTAKKVTIRGTKIDGVKVAGIATNAGATGSAVGVEFGPNNALALDNQSGAANFRAISCPGYSPIFFTTTWDPPATFNNAQQTTNFVIPGAARGDFLKVSPSIDLLGAQLNGYVANDTGTVTIILTNSTGVTNDPGLLTLNVEVTKKG